MTIRMKALLIAVSAVVAGLMPGLAAPLLGTSADRVTDAAASPADHRPNIVLVTTDDQTLVDMRWMPRTRRLLGGEGLTFERAMSPHPACCPARAEIVTGQYGQNNGVLHNTGELGGFQSLVDSANNLGAWLQDSGYQTALVGKYLNDYGREHGLQSGWTHWDASVKGVYSYDETTTYDDGNVTLRDGYIADVIRAQTNSWVEEFSAAETPFFIWASQLAPHAGRTPEEADGTAWPAKRHLDDLTRVEAPSLSSPAFNKADAVDRPVYDDPEVGRASAAWVQRAFTARIQSLQSVDEMVARLVRKLRDSGELENTYIFFTSDNGFLLGEHQIVGKNALYEEVLDVPMLVRGPGIEPGTRSNVPVTLTDLAPTFVDIANATPGRVMDGATFLPALHGKPLAWRDTQLVQTGTVLTTGRQPGWEWRGVRTSRYTYAYDPRTGQRQLFDRAKDPSELANVATRLGTPTWSASCTGGP